MRAEERLEPPVIRRLAETIRDAGGNEVFAVAVVGREGRVADLTIAARGNQSSVPALRPYLERGDVLIHNHPSGDLTPSGPDLAVASRVGAEGIGFYIVDNTVSQLYAVAEPVTLRERVAIDAEELAAILEPGGELARLFPDYEDRPTQAAMLRLVCRSFNEDRPVAAEAGTGVGKSLAYLIPAVAWATNNQERVVVSTSTINLQQQLIEKDIPLVLRMLGSDIKVALVKGRRNYLCPKRLAEAVSEEILDPDAARELQAIAGWSETTATGSRSDLSPYPSDNVWSRVCSEADLCHGLQCSLREGCFIQRARREASSARLLVANHHLLFSDLAVRRSGLGYDTSAVLPPFHRIVLDEAHNIEESATSFFSDSFHRFLLQRYLGRLHRRRRGRPSGLATALQRMVPERERPRAAKIAGAVQEVSDRAGILDRLAQDLMGEAQALLLQDLAGDLERLLWEPLGELHGAILSLVALVQSVLETVEDVAPDDFTVPECRMIVRRLAAVAGICERFHEVRATAAPDASQIFWIERQKGYSGERFLRFVISPLEVAPIMREAVYAPYPSVVFTSATLTVGGSFEYWRSRVGLDGDVLQQIFDSPFRYRERVLVAIPSDLPPPNDHGYPDAIVRIIGEALELSEGRALVLFTSYSLLARVCEELRPRLVELGIPVLRQGEDDRARLLQRFQSEVGSCLFATESFWQGVDAPGEALQVLILSRLPFRVPTEPVLKARAAALEMEGGNAFAGLSLPDAVVRLRQGFGRLMRRSSDGGVVLILDVRIVRKWYGRAFLDSLPETALKVGETRSVMQAFEDFVVHVRSGPDM